MKFLADANLFLRIALFLGKTCLGKKEKVKYSILYLDFGLLMENMKKETSAMVLSGSIYIIRRLIRFSNSRFTQNDK